MNYRERKRGSSAAFLLPSLKLKGPSSETGRSIENRRHAFLMETFGGYTAQAGNIFGYWRENGRDSYGERLQQRCGSGPAGLDHCGGQHNPGLRWRRRRGLVERRAAALPQLKAPIAASASQPLSV